MKKMTDKPELLAPAGGIRALKAAVQSGADAVYLGADRFSARAGADNFTLDTLGEWIDYCHVRGVKVHLAANTLIKEHEAQEFLDYVIKAYNLGIDAVIIQDIGMARILKREAPDICLHASTQMTVTSAQGVKYLENNGFSRVVLARELTKDELLNIRNSTTVELEMFAHGALCFCYSGQCLMSGVIGRRSGNRGMCAQPCRMAYELMRGGKRAAEKGYLMSPKDLRLAGKIEEIRAIGIDSLKIEGRLKSAEYVATVTGVYRGLIDGAQFSKNDEKALLGAFNRSGFTEGWYSGAVNMMSGKSPSNVADNKAGADFVKFTQENANYKKTGISIFASLKTENPLEITMLSGDGTSAAARGKLSAETAEHAALSGERLKQQLEKLGQSPFFAENSEIETDGQAVLPISEINAVRREAAQKLEAEIAAQYKHSAAVPEYPKGRLREYKIPYITAVCMNEKQAISAYKAGAKRVVLPKKIAEKAEEKIGCEVAALLSNIGADTAATKSVMVMNTAQIEANAGKKIYGGFRLNIYNSASCEVFADLQAITLSCELNLKEIKKTSADTACEVFAYGRIPLMLMRNCPAKIHAACRGEGGYSLRDRMGEKFPIRCAPGCTSELLNSKNVYMADKMADIAEAGADGVQLWFYDETEEEVQAVVEAYKAGILNETAKPDGEFTRGHFYRGVV